MKTLLNIPAILLLGLGIGMASPTASRAEPLAPTGASQPISLDLPLVSTPENRIEARYYWHRHHYWRRHYWRRHHWHRWHYWRRHHWWHRHHYWRRHYWHHHYWHRWHHWHPHYYYRRYWY